MSSNQESSHDGDEHNSSKILLRQPSFFLIALAETLESELAFFSEDQNGKFVYLSKSATNVLNADPHYWQGRSLKESLTQDPSNESVRTELNFESVSDSKSLACEIFDREGRPIRLQCWKTPVVHEGALIGAAGILRRVTDPTVEPVSDELIAKAKLLSSVERQVIEMVVDGKMNKIIAGILDVAVRTVESRRSRAMTKLDVRSLSELVQLWMKLRQTEAQLGIEWKGPPTPTDNASPESM